MRPENIAPNYNFVYDKPITPVTHIDKIHTGWAWDKSRSYYCGDETNVLPVGLVCFHDKIHSDVFSSLACLPFIAVLHFFNENNQCNIDNYVTLGYIPNLGYAKGKGNAETSIGKLQDQHNCIRLITDQITKLRDEGYFSMIVMGQKVKVIVWIHIVAGNCSGHNKVAGKFNCNGNTACPFHDCYYSKSNLLDSIPTCKLVTIYDVKKHGRQRMVCQRCRCTRLTTHSATHRCQTWFTVSLGYCQAKHLMSLAMG
jgi:hypothetical protein